MPIQSHTGSVSQAPEGADRIWCFRGLKPNMFILSLETSLSGSVTMDTGENLSRLTGDTDVRLVTLENDHVP